MAEGMGGGTGGIRDGGELGGQRGNTRRFAVVTGASGGIGLDLARQFLAGGFDVLVNSSTDDVEVARDALQAEVGDAAYVASFKADLSTYEGCESLARHAKAHGRPVDALALNAGVGHGGDFVRETDLAAELNLIALNVNSVVHLAKRLLPDMIRRPNAKLLITGSVVSEMPGPHQAVYAASKAFVYSFANAIRYELKDTGLTVTVLMPGATDTDFFERAGMMDTDVGTDEDAKNDPAAVARQGFEALMKGEDEVVAASFKTKAQGLMDKVLPENVKAALHAKMSAHGTAKH